MSFQIRSVKKVKKRTPPLKKILLIFFVVIILSFSIGIVYVLGQVRNVIELNEQQILPDFEDSSVDSRNNCGIFGCVGNAILGQGCSIKQHNNRTNMMLLGMGGMNHIQGGETLTDTIIVGSFDHIDKSLTLISIPRDLWVRPQNIQPNKINALYGISTRVYEGEEFGYVLPKAVLEDLTGLTMHYYGVIDFNGFVDVIDALGGVNVMVENAFTDREYPDGKYGYMVISFEEGYQYMDGERALQYVRSRHGNNGESGDFARGRRQQNLLSALKEKIISVNTLFKLQSLLEAVVSNHRSNVTTCEMLRVASLARDVDLNNIHSVILDDGPGGVLYTPTQEIREASYNGQYVLLPDGNNYNTVRRYIANALDRESDEKIHSKVAVLNGTSIVGLANDLGARLIAEGVDVVDRSNTTGRVPFDETIVVDVNPQTDDQAVIEKIQSVVNAKVYTTNPEPTKIGADVIVILGADYRFVSEEEISTIDE